MGVLKEPQSWPCLVLKSSIFEVQLFWAMVPLRVSPTYRASFQEIVAISIGVIGA